VAAAGAAAIGHLFWNRATAGALDELAAASSVGSGSYTGEELDDLPSPAARYLSFALPRGQQLIRRARIDHSGQFRAGGFGTPWFPFTSVQHVTTDPPGFVWDAAIRMAPLITMHVRDSYVRGAGAMLARLGALVTVVDESPRSEINAGALHRYLAEAVWYPTVLLPGTGVSWSPIDENSALATITDGATNVSLTFEISRKGEVVGIYTPSRYRDIAGQAVPTPWDGGYSKYTRYNGVVVPTEGEVGWVLPEGNLSYWRGHLCEIKYEFS
jgi:hypothetical protein